eukprot:156865_1
MSQSGFQEAELENRTIGMVLIGTGDNDNNSVNIKDQYKDIKPLRWDQIFANYLLSILLTGLAFAGSHDSKYDNIILMFGFWHFGFEITLSLYFLYSRETAFKTSICVLIVCFLQGLINWFVSLQFIFSLQFIVSDTFSILSSLCLLFNYHMPNAFKILPFSTSLHFIGVSLKLYTLPTEWYAQNVIPQHGAGWVYLGLFSLPQLYLCTGVIAGKLNHLGDVQYANSKPFIYFCKGIVPILSFVLFPTVILFLGAYRTTENETDNHFALGVWMDVMNTVCWPVCMFGILWMVYVWVKSHPLPGNKPREANQ